MHRQTQRCTDKNKMSQAFNVGEGLKMKIPIEINFPNEDIPLLHPNVRQHSVASKLINTNKNHIDAKITQTDAKLQGNAQIFICYPQTLKTSIVVSVLRCTNVSSPSRRQKLSMSRSKIYIRLSPKKNFCYRFFFNKLHMKPCISYAHEITIAHCRPYQKMQW